MEKNNFWNDVCRNGAILGILMSASMVFEQSMLLRGSMSALSTMSVEWLLIAVLFIYLLHRFTKQRSALYSADEGFTFGQGWGYVTAMSAAAGLIVGVATYLYRNVILGYETYTSRLTDAMGELLSNVPSGMSSNYAAMLQQMKDAPAPSILSTVGGSLFSYVLTGAVIGLFIGGILSRAPKPFAENE